MDKDQINKQGGPAFPISIPGVGDNGWSGMTLRDWFAGRAIADCRTCAMSEQSAFKLPAPPKHLPYAMIAVRNESK